ncbi:MAG: 50S ribosomal protein L4 [Candidatus Bathyarchaeota archaeon B24]|nr:MAG: 50S ribosomal protein L4 [Candidatus Bathyarchaeota archaeon B24]
MAKAGVALEKSSAKSSARRFLRVLGLDGKVVGRVKAPDVFDMEVRSDVIRRAVIALQTHRLQRKGTDVLAGKRRVVEYLGVGLDLSRVPRLKGTTRAAFVPFAVGGRPTHPPKVEKDIYKRVNKKEKLLALKSAIAATASKEYVEARGHRVEGVKYLPLVVVDEVQSLKKTKDVVELFKNLGVWEDVLRVKKRVGKIRAGKGKMRGRKYKGGKGPLIVVAKDDGIGLSARNIPGVDVVELRNLNVELLAPGGHPGRLTIWDRSSIVTLRSMFREGAL